MPVHTENKFQLSNFKAWCRSCPWVPVIVFSIIIFMILVCRFNFLTDDAYISFRYAKNLAGGHGLRFNYSSNSPVEGYSNLLWVLLMALFEIVHVPSPVASRLVSVCCGIIILWRLFSFCRSLGLSQSASVSAMLFYSTFPPVFIWSTSGLASIPFALLIFLAFEGLFNTRNKINLPIVLMACTGIIWIRTEGFIWAAFLLLMSGLWTLIRRDTSSIRPLLICGVVCIIEILILSAFRAVYFGNWIPHTAQVKVHMSLPFIKRGMDYVVSFLLNFPHLLPVLAGGIWFSIKNRNLISTGLAALFFVLVVFLYAILVGGDFMTMGRLLVPAGSFFALFVAFIINGTLRRPSISCVITGAVIFLSILPAFDIYVMDINIQKNFHFRHNRPAEAMRSEYQQWVVMKRNSQFWAAEGRLVNLFTQDGKWVVRDTIGAYGYYSKLNIHDTCGIISTAAGYREPDINNIRSPGHDRCVSYTFYIEERPFYFSAALCLKPYSDVPDGYTARMIPVGSELLQKAFRGKVSDFLKNDNPVFICLVIRDR